MITDRRKLAVSDCSGKHPYVSLEVNWSKKVDACRYIKVKVGDEEAIVPRNELLATLFLVATETQQQKFLPQTLTQNLYLETYVTAKAKKDIMVGEQIVLPVKIKIPKRMDSKSVFHD